MSEDELTRLQAAADAWNIVDLVETIKANQLTPPKMTLLIFEVANELFWAGQFDRFKQLLDAIDPTTIPLTTSLALNTAAFWAPIDKLDRKGYLARTAAHYRTLGREPVAFLGGLNKGLDLYL